LPCGEAEPPTKQRKLRSWAIAKKRKFVGIVDNQSDAKAAIKAAIEEDNVPPNEQGRLMAQRRD
jgi:hypothetical protein